MDLDRPAGLVGVDVVERREGVALALTMLSTMPYVGASWPHLSSRGRAAPRWGAIDVAPVRVGEIIIEGNEKTKDHVIRRELTFSTGDILAMEDIRNSLRKLGQLGYFEPIIPDFLVTDDPLVVDILLPVTENKTGRAAFGAGTARRRPCGYIEVDDGNFFGRGQKPGSSGSLADELTRTILALPSPIFSARPRPPALIFITAGGIQRDNQTDSYTLRSTGGEVTFGSPLASLPGAFSALRWTTRGEPGEGSSMSLEQPARAVSSPACAPIRPITSSIRPKAFAIRSPSRRPGTSWAATPASPSTRPRLASTIKAGRNDQRWR